MTKILNFALKIKGGGREGGTCEVLRPCHPPKFGTCTYLERVWDWYFLIFFMILITSTRSQILLSFDIYKRLSNAN